MTDEAFNARMDRLTERHEALTQSMELFQIEMTELRKAQEETSKTMNAAARLWSTGSDSVKDLLALARSHEERRQRLEERG